MAVDPNRAFLSLLVMNQNLADGATTLVDESPNDLSGTVVGNAQADTARFPTGMTSSWDFDGAGDRLTYASNALFGFGTGPFWIETEVLFDVAEQTNFIDLRADAPSQARPTIYKAGGVGGTIRYFTAGADRILGTDPGLGAYRRIALGRDVDGNTRLFMDGTQIGSTYVDANNYLDAPVIIGAFITGAADINGSMAALRIYKGVCLETEDHTPDTLPFPTESAAAEAATITGGKGDNDKRRRTIFKPTGLPPRRAKGKALPAVEARVADTHEIAKEIAREPAPAVTMTAAEIDREIGVLIRKTMRTEADEILLLTLMAAAAA